MTVINVAASLALGILGSLAAATVWLFALRRLRPRLELSPHLVEERHTTTQGISKTSYGVKILNRSARSVVDLRFELAVIRPKRTQGGLVDGRKLLPLWGQPPLVLPGWQKSDGESHNAYRARTGADLRKWLTENDHARIRFRVYARDELSGIGRVFTAEYHEPETDIKQGKFARGQSFAVVRDSVHSDVDSGAGS